MVHIVQKGEMKKLLHILVHPSYEKSRANKVLLNHIPNLECITRHDLYELYPTFDIDVKREKELLLSHEIIMIQHPLYWYSCPPLFKQWIDSVLEHGWAYGAGGTALVGKIWMQVLTTGGDEVAYSKDGFHKHELQDFLLPFKRTAELCHMSYHEPFTLKGTFKLQESDLEKEGNRFSELLEQLLEVPSHG